MNIDLFNDLYIMLRQELQSNKFDKYYFLNFLTGKCSEQLNFEEVINGQTNLRNALGANYRNALVNTNCLHIKKLCEDIFSQRSKKTEKIANSILSQTKQFSALYKRYEIPRPTTTDSEIILRQLFTACVTEKRTQIFPSQNKKLLKKATVDSTFGRDEDSKKLQNILNTHQKILISEQMGTGKTRFIQYCLKKWKTHDYYYVQYTHSLEATIRSIECLNDGDDIYFCESLDEFKDNDFSSSVLIIDHMYNSPNFKEEMNLLSSLSIKVIVITNNTTPIDAFYKFKLPQLSTDVLFQIFEHDSGFTLIDEKIKSQIINITGHNVLMTTLIATQCKKISEKSSTKSSEEIITQVLSRLNILDNHLGFDKNNEYKFKHSYDKKELNLIGHIKAVYNDIIETSNKKLKTFMKYIYCFGWSPLPVSFLESIIPSYDYSDLIALSEMHLLSLEDDTVQLTPLISHAVAATVNPSKVNYNKMADNLILFLNEYDRTLSVPYLSSVLLTMMKTIYDSVSHDNNKGQISTAKKFEKWQSLIYAVYNYYNQNGAYYYANEINNIIRYPKSLVNRHNQFDKLLFRAANNMNTEIKPDNMLMQIDSLSNAVNGKTNDALQSLDMTSLIENTLDSIIDRFCYFTLAYTEDKDQFVPYRSNLLLAMKKLLGYIALPTSKAPITLTLRKEKIHYYCGCQWLMEEPLSFENYIHTLYELKAYDNINIHIKGVAFTIFQMSSYMQDAGYHRLLDYSAYQYFLAPAVSELNELIKCCKFIPLPTFHLCLYAYINASMTQYTYINAFPNNAHLMPILINRKNMHNLFNRSLLDKETLEDATNRLETVYQKIETKLIQIRHAKR